MTYDIEVGQKTERKISYEEAVLYVFCLGDGWRLPIRREYSRDDINESWFVGRYILNGLDKWHVTPVRDIT